MPPEAGPHNVGADPSALQDSGACWRCPKRGRCSLGIFKNHGYIADIVWIARYLNGLLIQERNKVGVVVGAEKGVRIIQDQLSGAEAATVQQETRTRDFPGV